MKYNRDWWCYVQGMQSSSRKRKSLTISEKYAIIEYRDNSPNESLENLATRFNCGRSTVSEILGKQRQGIIDSYQAGSRNVQAKRQRKVKLDDVDRNLLNWCVGAFNANLEGITRDTLLNKAQSIARELDYSDEAICGINLDWVKRFKARHNIASLRQSGEAASVPDNVVDRWKTEQLSAIRAKFDDNDIFNLDETGLFWQVLPENTMQFKGQKCHGGKKSKQRITLLLGANATGSMKLPLLVIGKSAKPRCFTGIKELPVQYTANKKAWMTGDIFIQYLQKMDAMFRRQERHVCFILDNCPAHPRNVSGLTNIELHFLPPNATSRIQPMDAGVIKNFKVGYRKKLMEKRILAFDTNTEFKIDLLWSLRMVKTGWENVTQNTIKNCFRHCGFEDSERETEVVEVETTELDEVFERYTSAYPTGGITVEEFALVDEQVTTGETLESFVVEVSVETEDSSDDESGIIDELPVPKPSITSALNALLTLRQYMHYETGEFSDSLDRIEDFLRRQAMPRHQTSIRDYFSAN